LKTNTNLYVLFFMMFKSKRNKTRMKKIDSVLKHHFEKLADPNRPVDMLESDVEDDASTREDEEGISDSSDSVTDSETDADDVEKHDKSDKVCFTLGVCR